MRFISTALLGEVNNCFGGTFLHQGGGTVARVVCFFLKLSIKAVYLFF